MNENIQYPEFEPAKANVDEEPIDTPFDKDFDTVRVYLQKLRDVPDKKIQCPQDAVDVLTGMGYLDREHVALIYLDSNHRIIGIEDIAIGSINRAIATPRELLKGAILSNAAALIFVHNHPSGTTEPSSQDYTLSERMRVVFAMHDINMLDSLIIGGDRFYSFKAANRLEGPTEMNTLWRTIIDTVGEPTDDDGTCRVAVQAALETLMGYCGKGK